MRSATRMQWVDGEIDSTPYRIGIFDWDGEVFTVDVSINGEVAVPQKGSWSTYDEALQKGHLIARERIADS